MTKKRKYKFKKANPPFHWPLILLLIIFVEFVVLLQERAWSQNYSVAIDRFRDQVENLSYQNQKIFKNISNFYNLMVRIENENYLTKAQRNFLDINKKISLSLRNNNED